MLNSLTIEAQPGGVLLYSPELVFSRYNLEISISVLNSDIIDFEMQDSDQAYKSNENTILVDDSGREIDMIVTTKLPFIMQFQELGKENGPPFFES